MADRYRWIKHRCEVIAMQTFSIEYHKLIWFAKDLVWKQATEEYKQHLLQEAAHNANS